MTTSTNGTGNASSLVLSQDAYQQMLPAIMAVPEKETIHINLDVLTVVTTVLGALLEILALRDRIVRELPMFDVLELDKLELKARAMSFAQALYVSSTKPAMSLPELVEAGTKMRETLYSDAIAAANRGFIDPAKFEQVKKVNGHRPLAGDLQVLATTLRGAWASIAGKTAITPEELDQALFLADRLLSAIGERDQGPATVAEAALIRQQAYTLLIRGYLQARRAVVYLRWDEGDADTIAPSLHAGRNTPSRREAPQAEPEAPSAAPQAAVPQAPTAPVAPVAPVVPVGLPGSMPFVRS
jgi:hypothetical protein